MEENRRERREAVSPQLSSTVLLVLDKFFAEMRDDSEIDNCAVQRLESLLLEGDVPKPEDLFAALYCLASEGQS